MPIYTVDIGDLISGRTTYVEAVDAKEAYELGQEELDKNKFEKIIQIRNENNTLLYNYTEDTGLFPKIRYEG